MFMFKLAPIAYSLSDPIWMQSDPPHEACYVDAETENDARDAVASFMRTMRKRVQKSERIIIESPWLDPSFTTCYRVGEVEARSIPDGSVRREDGSCRED